jgi:hypothetical protein
MTFWSTNIEPIRENKFIVRVGSGEDFHFLAKSVSKPTLETDINEYKLINQIVKFPGVPKWTDITITYVDTVKHKIYNELIGLMLPNNVSANEWTADSIEKNDIELVIEQYDADGRIIDTWKFKNPFITSINFGDNKYESDEFVEIEINVAYDYAYLEKT